MVEAQISSKILLIMLVTIVKFPQVVSVLQNVNIN